MSEKKPMTEKAAERIGTSTSDSEFAKRAEEAAKRESKKRETSKKK